MTASKNAWKVEAACVVVTLFGQDRYLYKGAVLPSGVPAADITRLSNTGLIVKAPAPEADEAPATGTEAEVAAAKAASDAQEAADKAASADTEGATDAGAAKATGGRTAAAKPAK